MKRFSEQFHKTSQSVSLQASERELLRSRVVSYIEYHPFPQVATPAPKSARIRSESFKTIAFPSKYFASRWTAVAAMFLFAVIPALAERSVPGESLYAVKVQFNEEVRSTLTFDQQEKVQWETERLNRRIADARLLASKGELTEEVEAEVAAAVREHTQAVKHEIDELRESDADSATLASIELTTTLELQSASLQQDDAVTLASATSPSNAAPTQMLVDVLNETLSNQNDSDTASIPSYEKIMARIEQNTTRSYELLQGLSFKEGDTLQSELDRRLQDVNRSLAEANTLRPQDEAGASQMLLNALTRTQKLIVYMSDVNVNRAVALDTVVPVILTAEERDKQLAMLDTEINRKVEILEIVHPQLSTSVAEKVDFSIQAAKVKQAEARSASVNINSKEYAKDTVALLDDALKVVEDSGVSIAAATAVQADGNASTTATSTQEIKPSR